MGFVIAVIPARGGSKRVPRKNLSLCGGKALIAHTFEAAKSSQFLDRVILSTDDEEIATMGRQFGIEVPFLRPANLAADDAPMAPVLQHVLDWTDAAAPINIDALVLLQPTSPLRTG